MLFFNDVLYMLVRYSCPSGPMFLKCFVFVVGVRLIVCSLNVLLSMYLFVLYVSCLTVLVNCFLVVLFFCWLIHVLFSTVCVLCL